MLLLNVFKTKIEVSLAEVADYQVACESIARHLKIHGYKTEAFRDSDFQRFKNHPDPQRVLKEIKIYSRLFEEMAQAGELPTYTKSFLWRYLKLIGVRPTSDVFEHILEDDTVEVYTNDNWQIFRNLVFFDFVSMTVDEVATLIWTRDSKRSSKISFKALDVMLRLRLGLIKKTTDVSFIRPHLAQETIADKWLLGIQLKIVSPLFIGKKCIGAIVTNKSQVLSRPPQ